MVVCFLAVGFGGVNRQVALAQSCDSFDECTVNPVCQPDGTCAGTPKPDSTPCDDGNPCTTVGLCISGRCTGFPDINANGQSCVSVFGGSSPCLMGATCTFGTCIPQFKTCPQNGGSLCSFNVCNPANGECTTFNNTCEDACSTGTCNPGSGECTNVQAKPNGMSCNDFNECTSNDRCQAGECVAGGGVVDPTATPTSPLPTPTPSPTVVGQCYGDCDGDSTVEIAEVVLAIRSALEQASATSCTDLDRDQSGRITIDEVVAAVVVAHQGC